MYKRLKNTAGNITYVQVSTTTSTDGYDNDSGDNESLNSRKLGFMRILPTVSKFWNGTRIEIKRGGDIYPSVLKMVPRTDTTNIIKVPKDFTRRTINGSDIGLETIGDISIYATERVMLFNNTHTSGSLYYPNYIVLNHELTGGSEENSIMNRNNNCIDMYSYGGINTISPGVIRLSDSYMQETDTPSGNNGGFKNKLTLDGGGGTAIESWNDITQTSYKHISLHSFDTNEGAGITIRSDKKDIELYAQLPEGTSASDTDTHKIIL